MVTKFDTGIDLDDLSDEFDGQGQGHPVENVIFEFWSAFSVL